MDREYALKVARDAYEGSTTYVDANFRKQWEDGLRMFQSRHTADSKYNSEAYKYRSKIFRPKTRSVIRKNEAAAASAFFSNIDVVNIEAANAKDPVQVLGAKFYKELIQYRLTKTIPWFQTLIGGLQDAMTVGVVCSHQYWKYTVKTVAPIQTLDGPVQQPPKVLEDKPCIDLLPVENLRIDPAASWIDPINSSPYVIHLMPMYVQDVRAMGKPNEKTGEPGWDVPDDSKLLAATNQSYDPTRQTRENKREDSKDQKSLTEFDIVWVHKNIVRKDGEDWCYFTLGVEHLLCDPEPLSKYVLHGERPYVMGCAIIETHKIYPSGFPELGKGVQQTANELQNLRFDNVQLVLNKRYFAKRGAQVDLKSLVRNVPGSVSLMNNVNEDVREISWPDVTSSAYQEQDRQNVDFDELLGNFSAGSVMTNRQLNETVGGMGLISQGANQLTEYTIRTFVETWVEKVLMQLLKLEKEYETDENVITLMGQKINAQIIDAMFNTDVALNVNVGMNATDPMQRINKMVSVVTAVGNVMAIEAPGLNKAEIGKELFSLAGQRDGGRFLEEGGQTIDTPQGPMPLDQAGQMIAHMGEQLAMANEEHAKFQESMQELDQANQIIADLKLKLADKDAQNQISAAEATIKGEESIARVNLLEAQAVKTLVEAAMVPDPALAAKATAA